MKSMESIMCRNILRVYHTDDKNKLQQPHNNKTSSRLKVDTQPPHPRWQTAPSLNKEAGGIWQDADDFGLPAKHFRILIFPMFLLNFTNSLSRFLSEFSVPVHKWKAHIFSPSSGEKKLIHEGCEKNAISAESVNNTDLSYTTGRIFYYFIKIQLMID